MTNRIYVKSQHGHPGGGRARARLLVPATLLVMLAAAFPGSAIGSEWSLASAAIPAKPSGQDFAALVANVPQARINSESKATALKGLNLIGRQQLQEGSQLLNVALQLDPSNSYLQFFNAYAYHLMGKAGDAQKFSLAEQGYALAVQFDRSNWVAHYYLGMLHFEQRKFRAAQSALAEVLLFREDDQEVLFRMVAASYYAGDPVTAAACLDRLRKLDPRDPQVLRLSAIISAAIGQPDAAQRWLEQYQATNPDAVELARTQERVRHWQVVRRNVPVSQASPAGESAMPVKGARAQGVRSPVMIRTADDDEENLPAATTDEVSKFAPPPSSRMAAQSSYGGGGASTGSAFGSSFGASFGSGSAYGANNSPQNWQLAEPRSNRMVLVDVVLMRTEDSLSTRKGMNLLNTLSLQFGTATAPAFAKNFTHENADGVETATTTILRAVSVPALTYSLNIANSNANLNEVLARPTLAALDGLKSEFFSGTTLNAAVVSSGVNSSGSVQIEKEIGVKLSIMPMFLPDGKIKLTVDAQRTFLKPASGDVNFTYKVEVSKIMVNANVVMDFGETLVLGGLSEKETTRARDGVPLLQDIPGVQYLFSRKDTSDFQRSVLMLITPRKAQYTYRSDEAMRADPTGNGDAESMKELRARYGDWFKPYPNLASVFNHLNSSSIYREFRTGDVTLEKWNKQESAQERLKQALEFLFY